MLKKISLIILISLLLTSCFGSDTEVDVAISTDGLALQEKTDFSIQVPSNWEVINNTESILPKPNRGSIELAVASTTLKSGFKNNLLILSDKLSTITTSKDYSMLNNIGASRDYIDYELLNQKDITFADGDTSMLYIFEAKYNLDTVKLKFLQTSHICKQTKAFFLTIAIPTSTIDTTNYEELLKTFSCRVETEENLK